jgi:mannose/fructose/sorbose-specific phosphotransferase system IIA component
MGSPAHAHPVPVIFVGHGGHPDGMRDAVEMILGAQPNITTVSLPYNGSSALVVERVSSALDSVHPTDRGSLVLADLAGGSPANAVGLLALRHPELHLVAGLNLPMALAVLTSPESTAAGLASVALAAGRTGVVDIGARLRG